MPQKKHFAPHPLSLFACFLFCASSFAQTNRPAHRQPTRVVPPSVARRSAPHAKPSPAVPAGPTSLLNVPAAPARITLSSGKLSVEANNSSLSDILQQVAKAGGMKIEGLQAGGAADQRIFGSYGPGAPREVLSDLLNGSHYNVLMMGNTPAGTPREMALSVRSAGGVPNPPPQPANAVQQEQTDEDVQPPAEEQQENDGVPPAGVQENEPIQPPPGEQQNRVRTPQQILQELQRMHQQQPPQ